MENVIVARDVADMAGLECDKMAVYVAQMQGSANYYINKLKLCNEEKAEAEANVVKHNQALADANAKWNAALNSQAELWGTYYDLLEEYQKEKQEQLQEEARAEEIEQEDRPDEKCTFCGEMESECGGDHVDEMRDIIRESGGW